MDKERYVVIDGVVSLYKEKEPFTKSGESILGALEYDPDVEKVRCHECGNWYKALSGHVHFKHGELPIRDYKMKHGLKLTSALLSESTRKKFIEGSYFKTVPEAGKPIVHTAKSIKARARKLRKTFRQKRGLGPRGADYRTSLVQADRANARHLCHAQVLQRVKNIAASLGRTPSLAELKSNGISHNHLVYRFGKVRDAIRLAGLEPVPKNPPKYTYTKEQLLNYLSNFYEAHGRVPGVSDCKRGLVPTYHCYVRNFGSMANACRAVGLQPPPRWKKEFSKTQLLEKIKEVTDRFGRAPKIREWNELAAAERIPNSKFVIQAFGKWSKAVELAVG